MNIGKKAIDKKIIEETTWELPHDIIEQNFDIIDVIHDYLSEPILILKSKSDEDGRWYMAMSPDYRTDYYENPKLAVGEVKGYLLARKKYRSQWFMKNESYNFERGINPRKAMGTGILTWDKLKPGDILENKKAVFATISIPSKLFFHENENTKDVIRPGKYWIIKTIRFNKTLNETQDLEIEFVWAGILRHAISMAERIKQSGTLKSKNLSSSFTANHSIEEWDEWFKILQKEEMKILNEVLTLKKLCKLAFIHLLQ